MEIHQLKSSCCDRVCYLEKVYSVLISMILVGSHLNGQYSNLDTRPCLNNLWQWAKFGQRLNANESTDIVSSDIERAFYLSQMTPCVVPSGWNRFKSTSNLQTIFFGPSCLNALFTRCT